MIVVPEPDAVPVQFVYTAPAVRFVGSVNVNPIPDALLDVLLINARFNLPNDVTVRFAHSASNVTSCPPTYVMLLTLYVPAELPMFC